MYIMQPCGECGSNVMITKFDSTGLIQVSCSNESCCFHQDREYGPMNADEWNASMRSSINRFARIFLEAGITNVALWYDYKTLLDSHTDITENSLKLLNDYLSKQDKLQILQNILTACVHAYARIKELPDNYKHKCPYCGSPVVMNGSKKFPTYTCLKLSCITNNGDSHNIHSEQEWQVLAEKYMQTGSNIDE